MKKTLVWILLLSMLTLSSCSLSLDDFIKIDQKENEESTNVDSVKMIAKINAIGERIEVDVLESEYTSGLHWVIYQDTTPVYTEGGEKLSIKSLKPGDTVEILYNGQVMMSYPPQIVARRITKIS